VRLLGSPWSRDRGTVLRLSEWIAAVLLLGSVVFIPMIALPVWVVSASILPRNRAVAD
jgi:hypothetical protein